MLVNLSEIKQFYFVFQDSVQNINSQFNKPWIYTNHTQKKSNSLASYWLQQYLHYAPVQVRKCSCKKNWEILVCTGAWFLKHSGGRGKAHIRTRSNKVYSPEQPSQENSRRVSDTRFILFWNHAGELVVTAWSRVRPQTTDRRTCFTEMGNKQEHYLLAT